MKLYILPSAILLATMSYYSFAQSQPATLHSRLKPSPDNSPSIQKNKQAIQQLSKQLKLREKNLKHRLRFLITQINQQAQIRSRIINHLQAQLRHQRQVPHPNQHHPLAFHWVKIDNFDYHDLPDNVFSLKQRHGHVTPICQTSFKGHTYPGHVNTNGKCVISYSGKTHKQPVEAVLTAQDDTKWVKPDQVPSNIQLTKAVYPDHPFNLQQRYFKVPYNGQLAGTSQSDKLRNKHVPILGGFENHHYLYICRSQVGGKWHIGKQVGGNCNIPLNGKEAVIPQYEILASDKLFMA